MNNKYCIASISLILLLVSGCVFREPYPTEWKAVNTVPGDCPQISGTFSDNAELDPTEIKEGIGEQFWQTTLSSKFFLGWKEPVPVSHVEIIHEQNDVIRFIFWSENDVVFEKIFAASNKDFKCKSGFVEFVGDQECAVMTGIVACGTPEAHFTRSDEGALIMKENSRGFGLVYLLPAIVSQWHWYRFAPYQPNDTH